MLSLKPAENGSTCTVANPDVGELNGKVLFSCTGSCLRNLSRDSFSRYVPRQPFSATRLNLVLTWVSFAFHDGVHLYDVNRHRASPEYQATHFSTEGVPAESPPAQGHVFPIVTVTGATFSRIVID